jgi:hypothetical protein
MGDIGLVSSRHHGMTTGRYKATTGYCFEAIGYDCGVPYSRDLELREEALRLGRELLRGTKYEQER